MNIIYFSVDVCVFKRWSKSYLPHEQYTSGSSLSRHPLQKKKKTRKKTLFQHSGFSPPSRSLYSVFFFYFILLFFFLPCRIIFVSSQNDIHLLERGPSRFNLIIQLFQYMWLAPSPCPNERGVCGPLSRHWDTFHVPNVMFNPLRVWFIHFCNNDIK